MNKKKLLAFLVSSAFLFAACGDDNTPTSPNDDSGSEISSSSEDDECDSDECDEKSSSSKKGDNDSKSSSSKSDDKNSSDSKDENSSDSKSGNSSSSTSKEGNSSSSAKDEQSSSSSEEAVDVPEGARAAKLEDLEKNVELKLFEQTVYLSTGSKQGVVALRIPDELWVVAYTDFANGVVSFNEDDCGRQYAGTDAAKKILEELKKGFKISFIVDNNVVKYAVNGSEEYNEAVKASVAVKTGTVSKASDIKDKIYTCTDGDTTRTFKFFDNSYIMDVSAGNKLAYWNGGHYDIQRSTLLMLPAYYIKPVYTMYAYSVGSENTITLSNGTEMSCNVEAIEYDYEKASDFVGEWRATDKENSIDWDLALKSDGTFEFVAFKGNKNVELKQGVWEVYGYYMMMHNAGCLDRERCSDIYGQLQTGPLDKETNKISGFSFIHNGTDTPKIPTSFDAPQYE